MLRLLLSGIACIFCELKSQCLVITIATGRKISFSSCIYKYYNCHLKNSFFNEIILKMAKSRTPGFRRSIMVNGERENPVEVFRIITSNDQAICSPV